MFRLDWICLVFLRLPKALVVAKGQSIQYGEGFY